MAGTLYYLLREVRIQPVQRGDFPNPAFVLRTSPLGDDLARSLDLNGLATMAVAKGLGDEAWGVTTHPSIMMHSGLMRYDSVPAADQTRFVELVRGAEEALAQRQAGPREPHRSGY